MQTLKRIQRNICKNLKKLSMKYVDREAVILSGKFKGRRAKITNVSFNYCNTIIFLVQPYYKNHPTELMWDDSEARRFRRREEFAIEGDKGFKI